MRHDVDVQVRFVDLLLELLLETRLCNGVSHLLSDMFENRRIPLVKGGGLRIPEEHGPDDPCIGHEGDDREGDDRGPCPVDPARYDVFIKQGDPFKENPAVGGDVGRYLPDSREHRLRYPLLVDELGRLYPVLDEIDGSHVEVHEPEGLLQGDLLEFLEGRGRGDGGPYLVDDREFLVPPDDLPLGLFPLGDVDDGADDLPVLQDGR